MREFLSVFTFGIGALCFVVFVTVFQSGASVAGVRRAKAALSSGCKPHPATLQPEAIGAVMEVAKWLKPSMYTR
jgi:hypothetical protein